MANLLGQVTIPASGVIQISKGLQNNEPPNSFFQQITFQNNGGNAMRLGDVTVSSTRGIKLTASGSSTDSCTMNYGSYISDWWVQGTSGDVLDFLYIK